MVRIAYSVPALLTLVAFTLAIPFKRCSFQDNAAFIEEGTNGVAWGYFNDSIEQTEIISSAAYSDDDQMYCSGFLEGVLTHKRIDQLFRNFWESTFYPNGSNPTPIVSFTKKTIEWTYEQAFANNSTSDYWYQVGLVLIQLEGIVDGYNSEAENQLEYWQLYLLNMIGDLDDLLPALERQENKSLGLPVRDFANEEDIRSHCSSIVKPSPDFSELFASHEMWTGYYQMIEIYKHYHFNIQHPSTASNRVSFASYAGFISSEDDFYITDAKLVVMETTNGVYNLSIYDSITPSSVMSWVRVVVANRMSNSGSTWVEIMAKYNSGTYNNQWIVVDYKLVEPGVSSFAPNTLWIGSQMPGYFVTADVTNVLNSQGYWPSYNVPYFGIIYQVSGYQEMYEKYGDYYSYSMCPRKREGTAQNLTGMQHLMRYNDWENDPLSLGCPCNQIACRLDLAPLNDTGCMPDAFGAVNGKITATSFVNDLKASIVGGPSHDTQPPFSWTPEVEAQFPNAKHYGQPTTWNFDWMFTQPSA